MRNDGWATDAFELHHVNGDTRYSNGISYARLDYAAEDSDTIRPVPKAKRIFQWFLFGVPIIVAILPIALLTGYSPHLSRRLGSNACTLAGEFVIPYESSIWDGNRLFEISVGFLGPSRICDVGYCEGFTFTQAKIIDVMWDVVIGRGAQAFLVVVAYRLFSSVITSLMHEGEVGYDAFASVAFSTGTFTSLLTLLRHTVGWTPVPRSGRAVSNYVAMAFCTLYIVALPSLYSAMTGYTSHFDPHITQGTQTGTAGSINTVTHDCAGGFVPVWGQLQYFYAAGRTLEANYFPMGTDFIPIYYDYYVNGRVGPEWIECRSSNTPQVSSTRTFTDHYLVAQIITATNPSTTNVHKLSTSHPALLRTKQRSSTTVTIASILTRLA